jgi:hypothetical protein
MDAQTPLRYCTLWISWRRKVTRHHGITVKNHMSEHKGGIMGDLSIAKTALYYDMFFAVELASQILSKCHAEGTPVPGMLLISACILDNFCLQ